MKEDQLEPLVALYGVTMFRHTLHIHGSVSHLTLQLYESSLNNNVDNILYA